MNCCKIKCLLDLSAVHFKFVQGDNHTGVLMKDHFVVILFCFSPLFGGLVDFCDTDLKDLRQSFDPFMLVSSASVCLCKNERIKS